ncbi:unnamed protein product [Brassicogethes aeneus]|uniref:Nbr1 FW domain-containing protein n=1 Tax=Brassicogethes aeneus TaxID=1431903 RepID=A0A9P0ATZ1_BRAAE|nr:unnamed protein product [Brassicogethes aeneus]
MDPFMEGKKRDLEIIYNLQWKDQPANGGEKANIIGMYDIPATTLTWDVFKSYLLKNSGTPLDDVKVMYVTSNNHEFPIESQTDFQIALYAFRRKARMNEIITLKLDGVPKQQKKKNKRQSIDVETQFDEIDSTGKSPENLLDAPPQWFLAYMSQFKEEMSNEVKEVVATTVAGIKQPAPVAQHNCSCYHSRKNKVDPKRLRKVRLDESQRQTNEKELIKSLKLERKLENKLEYLESKTNKIRAKKLALFTKSTSDSDVGPSTSKPRPKTNPVETFYQMDAAVIEQVDGHEPVFHGGEVYMHKWKIVNTGSNEWTADTNLQYTWGSKYLRPINHSVPCPKLKTGEEGTVTVKLQIPMEQGRYECYWHFHHKGRRFGQWLGCQIRVEPFRDAANKIVEKQDDGQANLLSYAGATMSSSVAVEGDEQKISEAPQYLNALDMHEVLRQINTRMMPMSLNPTDENCSSDSDNQSVKSTSDDGRNVAAKLSDEFVVVPSAPEVRDLANESGPAHSSCYRIDSMDLFEAGAEDRPLDKVHKEKPTEKHDDNNNTENSSVCSWTSGEDYARNSSRHSDLIVFSLPQSEKSVEEGYAYVEVNGQGMHIPKKILKAEYLEKREGEPLKSKTPSTMSVSSSVVVVNEKSCDEDTQNDENLEIEERAPLNLSIDRNGAEKEGNCDPSAAQLLEASDQSRPSEPSDMTSSRVFVFPQEQAGYEIRPKPNVCPLTLTEREPTTEAYPLGPRMVFPCAVSDEPSVIPIYTTARTAPNTSTCGNGNPFTAPPPQFVANYQQTPPEERRAPTAADFAATLGGGERRRPEAVGSPTAPPQPPVHILPDALVSGAVNVASSAINTARSVINMIVPPRESGHWVNGHWVSANADTPREANLRALTDMGFWDRDLNASLLARYNDDLNRVVAELVQ